MKNNQQLLTTVEKKRYQYSAEYFSRGAALQLKNKFQSNGYKELQNRFEKIQRIKERQKENIKKTKKKLVDSKIQTAKFVAISGAVVVTGLYLVKKIEDTYDNFSDKLNEAFNFDEEREMSSFRQNPKVQEFENGLKDKLKGNFTEPVITGMQAMFGNKSNLLENNNIKEKGVFGTLLPDFGLMSIWYLFSKRGYSWILNLLNVRMPNYLTLSLGMWQHYAKDPTGYMFLGRTLKEGIRAAKVVNETASGTQNMLGEMNEMWVKGVSSWQDSHTNLEEIRTHINGILGVLNNINEIERVTPQTFRYKTLVMYKGGGTVRHVYGESKFSGSDVAASMSAFPNEDDYMIYSNSLERKIPYAPPSHSQQYGFVKTAIEYIEDTLYDLKVHDNQQYNIYKDQWNFITRFNKIDIKIYNPTTWRAFNDKLTVFQWTYERIGMLMQFVPYLAQWEILQSAKSVNAARGLYNEMFTNTLGSNIIIGLERELKNQMAESERFISDYARGQLSLDEVLDTIKKRLPEIIQKGVFSDFEKIVKLEKREMQGKIAYMKVIPILRDLESNVKEIKLKKAFRVNHVVRINQNTLRTNFQSSTKNGLARDGIKGKLFDKEYLNESEGIWSDKWDLLGKTPGVWLAIWEKRPISGTVGTPTRGVFGVHNNFYRWWWLPRGESHPNYVHEGDGYWDRTTGGGADAARNQTRTGWNGHNVTFGMDYVWSEKTPKSQEMANSGSRAAIIGTEYYTYGKKQVGIKYKNRYEMYGDDDKLYIVDIWDYYNIFPTKEYVKSELISQRESTSSNAALFHGEYTDESLNNIYKTPSEETVRQILSLVDLGEELKEELLRERCQIINDINVVNFENGDTGLMFALIS